MAKETLVNEYIEETIDLINELDKNGFPIEAALWYYLSESEEWQFLIATKLVDEAGKKAAYQRLFDLINSNNILKITPLRKITIISPQDPLISILRLAIFTGPHLSKMRFQNSFINNVFTEDALIYRLQ
ncbi:MAG: hypothetical protein ACUVRZ_00275 [Desulfobacca sp.]|uniref:hypothetical protein n=1 Tax=Desulfobacca sp. TaxID=2067990 RepID=UPI00404A0DAA